MRISDDRYSRDRLRLDLALRFIRLEARTHTIRQWTGLTDDRIRKLYRSYVAGDEGPPVARHRGKSPQQAAWFLRTAQVADEAATFAGLCCLFGVIPPTPLRDGVRSLYSVQRGELLAEAFETYRALCSAPRISFEHAVFLVTALARGDELRLGRCTECRGPLLADRLALHPPVCSHCVQRRQPSRRAAVSAADALRATTRASTVAVPQG